MRTLICLLLIPVVSFSQNEWENVDSKVFMELIREYEKSVPEGENYSIETGYKIFSNTTSQMPVQTFDGRLICKSGKALNVFQMGHLMIQDETLNLTIDTMGKKILIQNPDPSFFYRKTVEDYSTFLEMAETVQKRKVGDQTVYRLKLKKGNPYLAMDFTFSEKNFITQITIYSSQAYYQEDDLQTSDKAKIVLDFKNFRKGKSVDLKHFLAVKDCISIKEQVITPTNLYKGFEVIDLRN